MAVMTACRVIPRARMKGAPKSKNVCHFVRSTTINANMGTMIDRPIKMPAMKLPAPRNLAREESFTIDSFGLIEYLRTTAGNKPGDPLEPCSSTTARRATSLPSSAPLVRCQNNGA